MMLSSCLKQHRNHVFLLPKFLHGFSLFRMISQVLTKADNSQNKVYTLLISRTSPLFCSVAATLASSLFLVHSRHLPTSGALHCCIFCLSEEKSSLRQLQDPSCDQVQSMLIHYSLSIFPRLLSLKS